MIGSLSSEEIERVLHAAFLGRIGCQIDGRPYVVPTNFAYDGQRILAHTAPGRKLDAMRQNPEVCFEVEQVDDPLNWKSVIAWGRFRELSGDDAAAAMGFLVDRLRPTIEASAKGAVPHSVTPTFRAKLAETTVVYALELTEKSGRFERQIS